MDSATLIHDALWAASVVIVYAIATRGLFRATNRLRLSLIDLAAELLKSHDVPKAKKDLIRHALNDVHSARSAWGMTIMFPIAFVTSIFWRPSSDLAAELPGKLQGTFEAFLNRWFIATISNSVMATILCTTFVVIVSAFATSMYPIALLIMKRRSSHGTRHVHA